MPISIEVIPLGPVAVGARAWRHRGRRLLTAIVKASFSIHHDGPMSIDKPAPIVNEERHYRNNPVASLVRASDLALLVPKPEVVIVGHAYAAPGQSVQNTTVRLAVARDTNMLVNKRLDIIGDRRAKPGEPPSDPTPFEKIPVLYERARGGISSRDNPVGVGLGTDPDGLLTLPNVELPPQGGVQPAGLGPIPSAWPIRQKKRGSLSWSAANTSLDVDVPDDFDDAYFQTAPTDQQTHDLRGGDLIAIVNMHPEIGTLRTFLPSARAVALAQTAGGERISLALRIDTVHIQPDMMRAEVVYRGATVVNDEQLVSLRLAGAIEEPDQPFAFPDLSSVGGLVTRPAARVPSQIDLGSTAVIAEEPSPAAQRRPQTAPPPAAPPARGHAGTMIIEPDPPPPAAKPAARASDPPPRNVHQSTLVLEPEFEPKSLPFQKRRAKAGTAELDTRPAKIADGPPPNVKVRPASGSLSSTLDIMEDTQDAASLSAFGEEETLLKGQQLVSDDDARVMLDELTAKPTSSEEAPTPRHEPPSPPPAAVRAPSPPPPAPLPRSEPPPEPEPPPAPPPRPAPQPRPAPRTNVANDLYKRFKK